MQDVFQNAINIHGIYIMITPVNQYAGARVKEQSTYIPSQIRRYSWLIRPTCGAAINCNTAVSYINYVVHFNSKISLKK